MAGNLTNYLENKLLDHFLGTTSYTMPSPVYVALFTVAPGDAVASDSGGRRRKSRKPRKSSNKKRKQRKTKRRRQ